MTANFGGGAIAGAIVVCYGWGEGDDQLWGSGRRAIAGWVPISSSYIQGHQFHPDTRENNNEFCLELLADVTLFSTLITQKFVLAIWGLCWYNFIIISPISPCHIFFHPS